MTPRTGKIRQPGRPSASQAHPDLREQLLDAATGLFARQGIAATTMGQIAAQAGVTPAMVHYHFTNRDQLLDAVVDERVMRVIGYVWGPVGQGEAEPLALVAGLLERLFESAERQPWLPPLWLREVLNEGGQLRERMLPRLPSAKLQWLAERLADGQRAGSVNPAIEPRLVFLSLLGMTLLSLATASLWQRVPALEGLSREQLQRHVWAMLAGGLSMPPEEGHSGGCR
ncbi:TetR/AcrR family transcriptional regulator [Neisseriaceae bacterium JH1-16]|nr:TetR/AcrR family transcriptional regulator [Neisseriaceae bacterium JH1-16]